MLIHYFYNFVYNDSFENTTTAMSFAIKVYALADKYDVPQLQALAAQRLSKVCDPNKDMDDFLNIICLIDGLTNPADSTLWHIVIPKIKTNIGVLLQSEEFMALVLKMKDLNFKLLALLDGSKMPVDPGPDLDLRDPYEHSDDEEAGQMFGGAWGSRGRRLG